MVDGNNHYICTAGLLDAWRQPRVGFDMYKALINEEKEPLLQARNFTDSTSSLFLGTGIVLALILMLMVNRSRRFREYFIRSLVRPYNFYADIRDQRILSTKQTAGLGIVIAAGSSLILASTLYYLRTDARMEYLMHLFISDGILSASFAGWHGTRSLPLLLEQFFAWVFWLQRPACSERLQSFLRDVSCSGTHSPLLFGGSPAPDVNTNWYGTL